MNSGMLYFSQVALMAFNSSFVYMVPYSVGKEMYTIPGWAMWGQVGSA